MLERTTEVNYCIKRPQYPISRSNVVYFDNLKIYHRRHPDIDASRRNQSGKQSSLEKEGEDVLESPERHGIISMGDLSEDRGEDELPDFCPPIPEPGVTGHQVIYDPEYDGTCKVDGIGWNGALGIFPEVLNLAHVKHVVK